MCTVYAIGVQHAAGRTGYANAQIRWHCCMAGSACCTVARHSLFPATIVCTSILAVFGDGGCFRAMPMSHCKRLPAATDVALTFGTSMLIIVSIASLGSVTPSALSLHIVSNDIRRG